MLHHLGKILPHHQGIRIPPLKKKLVYKESTVYEATNTSSGGYEATVLGQLSYAIHPTYGEARAFVSVNSFMKCMGGGQTYTLNFADGGLTYTFSGNMGTFSISEEGECTFSDFFSFASLGLEQPTFPNDPSEGGSHFLKITDVVNEKPDKVTYSLGDHDLPYYIFDDDVYLLTGVMSTLFLYGKLTTFAFNGANFYLISDPTLLDRNKAENSFAEHYYTTSTSYSESSKSESQAKLDGDSFLFTLDVIYGFKDEGSQYADGYGAYLAKEYPSVYEDLYSTDIETVLGAYDAITVSIMADGHSDSYSRAGLYGSFYNQGIHRFDGEKTPVGERYNSFIQTATRLSNARNEALGLTSGLGEHYLDIDGDTAIIRFDSFVSQSFQANLGDEFYASHVEQDVFSLFHTSYNKIASVGGVENVIIDLSCNLGGDSFALLDSLGFVLDNPSFIIYDHAAKRSMDAKLRTDCNADGIFTEGESPANLYTHYVLTSGASFSCGNAFPYFAKLGGVKIIGQKSGGGSCVVAPIITGEGYPVRISGAFELAKTKVDDPSIDGGVEPDILIPEEDFYDMAKLKAAIAS